MNIRYILLLILVIILSSSIFIIFGVIAQILSAIPVGVACGLIYTHELDKKATVYILNTINNRL